MLLTWVLPQVICRDARDTVYRKERKGKGREGKGREGKGREGKGREGKGREGKGREGKGREGKGREGKGREGKEGKGREGKGREGNKIRHCKSLAYALNPSKFNSIHKLGGMYKVWMVLLSQILQVTFHTVIESSSVVVTMTGNLFGQQYVVYIKNFQHV